MVAIELDFPPPDVEEKIVCHEAGIDHERAAQLVQLAQAIRRLETAGLREVASTRVLIAAGRLADEGIPLPAAARAAIAGPLTDDPAIGAGLQEMIDYLPGGDNDSAADAARPKTEPTEPAPARNLAGVVGLLAVVAGLIAVAVNARAAQSPIGSGTPRSADPRGPVEPLFGFDHWITLHQVGTVVMMVTLVAAFVIGWRRHPRHPVLLMVIVMTVLIWQDPIMNWAPYAVYNPKLWHWPETWPLVSLSPTVEPFIVIGYATFYMAPFFPAVWLLRRLAGSSSGGVLPVAASAC